MQRYKRLPIYCLLPMVLVSAPVFSADGKLIGTAGLTQIEGAGGGGLVPWATLSGYDSEDQISASSAVTVVDVDDYRLNAFGMSALFMIVLKSACHISALILNPLAARYARTLLA